MPLSDHVFWLDSNLPPKAASWLIDAFGVMALHVYHLNLLSESDTTIFDAAKQAGNTIIITKDEDFVNLVLRKKAPPKIIWITLGNLSNNQLKLILISNLAAAVQKLEHAEYSFIEIN